MERPGDFFFLSLASVASQLGFGLGLDLLRPGLALLCPVLPCAAVCAAVCGLCSYVCAVLLCSGRGLIPIPKLSQARVRAPLACQSRPPPPRKYCYMHAAGLAASSMPGSEGGIRLESELTNPVRREARAGGALKEVAWTAQSRIRWTTGLGLELPLPRPGPARRRPWSLEPGALMRASLSALADQH